MSAKIRVQYLRSPSPRRIGRMNRRAVKEMAVQEQELKKQSGDLNRALNQQLANWSVMYVKLHHFHWYVKGPHFPTLHAKFEELYNLAAEKLDELAERMLAIGMQPASTMKEFLALAAVQEAAQIAEKDTEMVQSAVTDFQTIIEGTKQVVKLAEQADDDATADIATGHIEDLQKQVWMLNAILGK